MKFRKKLRDRLSQIRDRLIELDRQSGLFGPEGMKPVEAADGQMKQASYRLDQGRPSPAIGDQRDAVSSLESLEESFKSAEEAMQNSSPGGAIAYPSGSGMMGRQSPESVLLPELGSEDSAEAWWKAIMDAMKEKPPVGYEDITREYFLELAE